ncbi:MAG: hypothetical protein C0432_03010 [Candidatus Puniceispirillum sp.]|nr:hypothetical protein [Candidatus Pelagibacter sp.]MBA4283245.1 hypothetical protein [Candidatus Puniceispirillum sp.]
MSKIVYLALLLVYCCVAFSSVNEFEQNENLSIRRKSHILKRSNQHKVYCETNKDQNNLISIDDTYPELQFQSVYGAVQHRKIKESFEMIGSKYFIQRLRGAIYLRIKLRQSNPVPLDWAIADFSSKSNHSLIQNLAVEKLKHLSLNTYPPYQHKSLLSLWNTQDPTLQQSVMKKIKVFQNILEITISNDINEFESTLGNILFGCFFSIQHSWDTNLSKKSHSILNYLIRRFTLTTAFSEKIKGFNFLKEIKNEDGDLCIAAIYTHIIYLYCYNNNNIIKYTSSLDKKNYSQHIETGVKRLFESLHQYKHTAEKRFNVFYQLYFTFFKNLRSQRIES